MKAIVILPTYNERETIKPIIEKIFLVKRDIEIIVVDDNSPDGTGLILDSLAKIYPGLEVIHRSGKRGRGSAGILGFKRALEREGDYIIEMDADLSHDPRYIPSFIEEMENADIVIGSRYIKGAGIAERSISRNIISLLANLYIKFTVGISKVKDCTSGFRCFKKEVLESIHLDSLESKGPSIVTEILYRCKNYNIKEIPIVFKKRAGGKSKFNFQAIRDSISLGLKLRLASYGDRSHHDTKPDD